MITQPNIDPLTGQPVVMPMQPNTSRPMMNPAEAAYVQGSTARFNPAVQGLASQGLAPNYVDAMNNTANAGL